MSIKFMHVSRLSLLSILAVMISACQPPSAKELTVLASDTVEAVIEQVQSDDTAVQETVAENTITDAIAEDDQTEEDAEITVASIPEEVQAPPSLDPYSLIGTPLSDLVRRLGEPDYIRIDADVEIYQYRLVHCVVDFVALPVEGSVSSERPVTSIHARHSKMGQAYDDISCRLDLGGADQIAGDA